MINRIRPIETKKLFAYLKSRIEDSGLALRGACAGTEPGTTVVLAGQIGSDLWPQFLASAEFNDGLPHPMDRWSRRIGEQICTDLESEGFKVTTICPSDGPPFPPFMQWALQSSSVAVSALGMLIDSQAGLWHAYRFALVIEADLPVESSMPAKAACDTCSSRPCLSACPVDAYSDDGFDVAACYSYLYKHADAPCHTSGCLARGACPEGREYAYDKDHAAFHMVAFFKARLPETKDAN